MSSLRCPSLSALALILLVLTPAWVLAQDWTELSMDPGVNVNDLVMLDDGLHGWAVGTVGAGGENLSILLRTVDGITWESDEFPSTQSPNGVCFVSPNLGWVVCNGGRIFRSDDGGLSWQSQSSGTARKLSRVTFLDENEGWVTGGWQDGSSYLVLHSTNGGVTWQNQSFGSTCYSCSDIFFADALHGWICGYDSALEGHIHHTDNGGATWTRQTIPFEDGEVASLAFADAETGWATTSSVYATPSGAILFTQDGGDTWSIQDYSFLDYNSAIDCQDDQHVAITSYQSLSPSQQKLMYSTDGGENWNSETVPMLSYSRGIQYVAGVIRLTGSHSRIMRTDDLGVTWSWDNYAPPWNSVGWRDEQTGWLATVSFGGSDGYALRTDNGGLTWAHDPDAPGGSQILFVDSNHGWMFMSGDNGRLWRTVDGGESWTQHFIGTTSWADEIFFVNENRGWACGSEGMIRRSDNGGQTWVSQASGTSYYVEVLFFIDENEGWAAGGYGGGYGFIRHTTDGGDTWLSQSPATSGHHQAGYFVDNQHGWLVTFGGQVHRTVNGGLNWQYISSVPQTYIYDLWMLDDQTGWLLTGNAFSSAPGDDGRGFIYKTEDGGLSWTEEWTSPWPRGTIYDVTPHPSGTLWACGAHNTLLAGGSLTGVADFGGAGTACTFHPAAPNPFTACTRIRYVLAEPGPVKLTIYDVQGRRMKTLVDRRQSARQHEVIWNGEGASGLRLPSGVYFARLLTERGSQVQRLVLLH